MANKTLHIKKALLRAMRESLGIVTTACETVGVSRTTYYTYLKKDAKFRVSIDDIEEVALDFVEGKLLSQINENNPTSTIFYLKTKGQKRGYIEPRYMKMEISGPGGAPLTVTRTLIDPDAKS